MKTIRFEFRQFVLFLSLLFTVPCLGATIEGDVNGDGVVNILDITAIINVICGSTVYNEDADVNNDGVVSSVDLLLVNDIILDREILMKEKGVLVSFKDETTAFFSLESEIMFVYSDQTTLKVFRGESMCMEMNVEDVSEFKIAEGNLNLNTYVKGIIEAGNTDIPIYISSQFVLVNKSGGWLDQFNGEDVNFLKIGIDDTENGYYLFNYGKYKKEKVYNENEVGKIRLNSQKAPEISNEVRQALMDFYYATGGDSWTVNTNWGSNKRIKEWYGITVNDGVVTSSGKIYPSTIYTIDLHDNNLVGVIPESFIKVVEGMKYLKLQDNHLSGVLPSGLSVLSDFFGIDISGNDFSGEFPEHPLHDWMNKAKSVNALRFCNNNWTSTIPQWARTHTNFENLWSQFCIQKGNDASIFDNLDIPGPRCLLTDLEGNDFNCVDVYKNNKLTILYEWATWCPYSAVLNTKLIPAYNQYKEKGLALIGYVSFNSIPHDTREGLDTYCKEKNVIWPNVARAENNSLGELNMILPMETYTAIPKVFAIDNNGKVIFQSMVYNSYYDIIPIIEQMFGPIGFDGYYTSTDYSHDGEVMQLQQATVGKGIDIVLVGEAFVDKDMDTGGKYEQKMREAMEQFFAVEPYQSLRNRFNVYTVKVVSPNEEFADDASHALNEDNTKVFEYAKKALGNNPERIMVGVVYNTNYAVKRSHCFMYLEDGSFIAYMFDGVSSVLNHEMGGHGFGQLYDEYVEPGNETLSIPTEEVTYLNRVWDNYGAGANVDIHSTPVETKWSRLVSDERYAAEGLGAYEGSYLYGHGVYRPTQNSMMRYNDSPFNAPSREAIYKRIMERSEANWAYDYEKFVEFDISSGGNARKSVPKARRRAPSDTDNRTGHQPPTIIIGTWRDAIK